MQFDSKENDLTGHAAVLDVALASAGSVGPAGATGSPVPRVRSELPGPWGQLEPPDRLGLKDLRE